MQSTKQGLGGFYRLCVGEQICYLCGGMSLLLTRRPNSIMKEQRKKSVRQFAVYCGGLYTTLL
jgi:hypothetical protein